MAAIDVEIGYQESREITRREAKNFYYAFLTLPHERRRAMGKRRGGQQSRPRQAGLVIMA